MLIESSVAVFVVVFAYWLGGRRMRARCDALLLMRGEYFRKTHEQTRLEQRVFLMKLLVIFLIGCIWLLVTRLNSILPIIS